MSQPTVSIVGAGICGLALGRCLLQRGIRAVLYEKAPSNPRHAYAITLQPASYRPLLKALNLDEDTFRRRVAVDAGIGGSGEINTNACGYRKLDTSSFRANRRAFEDLLKEGLDVRWEHALQKVQADASGKFDLEFANGQIATSDIIISAEGPHSVIRKDFLPSVRPDVLPYVAFNGKRKVPRELFNTSYAASFDDTTVLEVRQNDTVLNISLNSITHEEVSISWIYSRPARGPSDALYKPNRSNADAKDIPEEFFEEIEALHGLSQPFTEIFNAEHLRKERILHWLMRGVLVSKQDLQSLGDTGPWFVGDAAHAEPIIGGGGANEALEDGVSLAAWIAEHGTKDISSWYDARYADWREGQDTSRTCIARIHGRPEEIAKDTPTSLI